MGKKGESARSRSGKSSVRKSAKSARAAGGKSNRKAAKKRSEPAKKSARESARPPEPMGLGPISEETMKPKKTRSRRVSGAERKARIRQAKARLLERREVITSEMREGLRAYQSASHVTKGDSSDLAAEALDTDTAMQLAEGEAAELAQIDKALKNIDERSYGLCETCDEEIPWARLAALPYATLCVKCKEQQELAADGSAGPAGWSAVGDLENLGKD